MKYRMNTSAGEVTYEKKADECGKPYWEIRKAPQYEEEFEGEYLCDVDYVEGQPMCEFVKTIECELKWV